MTELTAVRPPLAARDVLISVNPRAGARSRREQIAEIEAAIRRAGYKPNVVSEIDELASHAATGAKEGGLRAVLAVGGDGTAGLVRNHVPLEVPLLPVPMGTENLLGRYLEQEADPAAVVSTLDEGVTVGLDLGRVDNRYFLLMLSVGFDAEVIRRLHATRCGNITRLSYIMPTLAAVRGYPFPEIQVYCEGDKSSAEPLRCRWLFGFNLPLYACGWQVSPDASGSDGLLDLCAFQRGSAFSVIRYLWHVTRRGHHLLDDTVIARGNQFHLEATAKEEVAYQIDGDFGGFLPIDVSVLKGELRLLVSRSVAAKLGFVVPQIDASVEAAGA